jgi:hypothetical protein
MLETLPELVLDEILLKLDKKEYRALSQTCTTLHYPANRYLYQCGIEGIFCDDKRRLLERSLRLNPANGEFLKVFTSFKMNGLKEIWSRTPLRLRKLKIEFCVNKKTSAPDSSIDLFSSMHQDTWIEELEFGEDSVELEMDTHLLQQLCVLPGVERLALDMSHIKSASELQRVLDDIDCPRLKHLSLTLGNEEWHVLPGNNLPKLESLSIECHDEEGFGPLYNIRNRKAWTYLKALIARKIAFRVDIHTFTDEINSFFRTAYRFGSGDELKTVIEALIRWEHYFQTVINKAARYDIDIRDLPQANRNSTLEFANDIPQPYGFKISVWQSDETDEALLDILQVTPVAHLDITMRGNLSQGFIPDVICGSHSLSSLAVNIYADRHEGSSKLFSSNNSSCTRANFRFS